MSRSRTFIAVLVIVAFAVLGAIVVAVRDDEAPRRTTLRNPIQPAQQTALAFGDRSHWLQPWRAYLDTPPATRLRDAIGINFNVEPQEAEATARLLRRSGFTRARVEIGWNQVDYENPRRLADLPRFKALIGALARHGIRPLILLNANQGAPGPTRLFTAQIVRPVAIGARKVSLAPATARQAVPGRTGLNDESGKAANVIFTAISRNGTATLSKPLPRPLDAGPHQAATLRYQPFGPPRLRNGRPNPRFEATLKGWLTYARTVVREARALVGSDDFDMEVWNELSFGSDFLFQERYYDPPREQGKGDVTKQILARTVRALRGRGSPAPRIGIGDGFASETPFPAGSTSPPGLTALAKHPYSAIKRFPQDAIQDTIAPLDAFGRPSYKEKQLPGGKMLRPGGDALRQDDFIPRYTAFFPEYFLTAIQTETIIRDLSPITNEIYGTAHGRRTRPRGGSPPTTWVTEANLDPTGADPTDPSKRGRAPIDRLTSRDVRHLQAKAALRYYTAFVNKGVSAVDLFAVKGANLALVDPRFFARLKAAGGDYPGDGAGGETTRAVRRLVDSVEGSVPMRRTEPLSLLEISDTHGHFQFRGDGTRARPPLYDRDVTAFLPFQVRPGRYVAAAYVMTRNLAELYDQGAAQSDPRRYDMPEALFRLTIGVLKGSLAQVSATDPLTGSSVPVKVIARRGTRITLELPLTDSPRLLTLTER